MADFWECACEIDYMKPNHLIRCRVCGTYQDDTKESRKKEVEKFIKEREEKK